jgi:CheY-like chemotaxis protein
VLLNAVLAYQGFIVYWAADGFHAVELYKRLYPDIDIVLLEVEVPGLDGPQILDALQELNPELCCCFMTAGSEKYTEEELLQRGARHVLRKPFHVIQVAQLLRQLADRMQGVPPARTVPADGAANPPYTARPAGAPTTCPGYQAIEDAGLPELYLG